MSKLIQQILEDEKKINSIIEQSFDAFDKHKTGKISLNDVKNILLRIIAEIGAEPPTQKEFDIIFSRIGEDNKITLINFSILIKEVLASLVKNENDDDSEEEEEEKDKEKEENGNNEEEEEEEEESGEDDEYYTKETL